MSCFFSLFIFFFVFVFSSIIPLTLFPPPSGDLQLISRDGQVCANYTVMPLPYYMPPSLPRSLSLSPSFFFLPPSLLQSISYPLPFTFFIFSFSRLCIFFPFLIGYCILFFFPVMIITTASLVCSHLRSSILFNVQTASPISFSNVIKIFPFPLLDQFFFPQLLSSYLFTAFHIPFICLSIVLVSLLSITSFISSKVIASLISRVIISPHPLPFRHLLPRTHQHPSSFLISISSCSYLFFQAPSLHIASIPIQLPPSYQPSIPHLPSLHLPHLHSSLQVQHLLSPYLCLHPCISASSHRQHHSPLSHVLSYIYLFLYFSIMHLFIYFFCVCVKSWPIFYCL